MRLNLENDYAYRIILKFTTSPEGKKFRSKDLSDELVIPERFTYRILRKLLLSGLIDSVRGPKGGYVLAKAPQDITLYDVYTAISGEMIISHCLEEQKCGYLKDSKTCVVHEEIKRIQEILINEFKNVDFGELTEKSIT